MRLLARLIAAIAAWRGVGRAPQEEDVAPSPPPPSPDPRGRHVGADPRAELLVVALLLLTAAAAIAFVVVYVAGADTQLLGLSGGVALAALAGALLVGAARVVPQERAVEERPPLEDPEAERAARAQLHGAVEGISRRRLLTAAGGAAGAAVAAAAVVPAASLGPRPGAALGASPWRRGVALVDEEDRPLRADEIAVGSFATAFPQGADKRELGAPVVLVRLAPGQLRLPPTRAGWAPGGVVAYSKICTHAGCAIALYRSPTFEATSKPPGLVCPCHYSTFDPRDGGSVEFGPAGRPLPQLPLIVDAAGVLHAAGPLSGPVGPAWWGVGQA